MPASKIKALLYWYWSMSILALLLLLTGSGIAATNVSGVVSSDTTWALSGSPYMVIGSVLVDGGVTLTIEAGVTVKFNTGKALQINGGLVAKGTTSKKISFTSSKATPIPGDWGYILFSDSSIDAVYDVNDNYAGGSILEYVVIEYAGGVSVSNNGALRLDNAHPFINHATIRNNLVSGIYGWDLSGTLKVMNSTVTDNTTQGSGGGIHLTGGAGPTGTVIISKTTISNNTASGFGGGIWAYGETVTVSDCTIANNTGYADGGGINVSGKTVSITNSDISDNVAFWPGGFSYASFNGGGIFFGGVCDSWGWCYGYNGIATITNNRIDNNIASMSGGGIYIAGGTATISGNIISNNTDLDNNPRPPNCGGGIRVSDGTVAISENVIINNVSEGHGGGLYVSGGAVTISRNFINSNSAALTGGGIAVVGGTVTIVTNTISENTAPNASAVRYCCSDDQIFRENLFIGNTSTGSSPTYTVYIADNSHPLLNDNNLFGNSATYQLWNDNTQGSANVNARNNWWGTASASAIQSKIYDWFDDSSKGIADYIPYAASARPEPPISPPKGFNVTAGSGQINLSWISNPESDVAGYNVYWDTNPGPPYANAVDAGNVTSYTIEGIPPGLYYITLTAYDTSYDPAMKSPSDIVNPNQINGNESWYVAEQALAPAIDMTTSSTAFGSVKVGTTSAALIFTLSNTGNLDLVITSIGEEDGDKDMFSVLAGGPNPCLSLHPLIPVGGSCTLSATFSPTSKGDKSTTLRVLSNDPDTPVFDVPLTGTGFVPQYALSIQISPPEGGSVSPLAGSYDEGVSLSLQAISATGYRFDHWEGALTGSQNPAPLTMNGNKSITVSFVRQYNLITAVSPPGGGSISPLAGPYDEGTALSLQATPATGYRFDHWEGALFGSQNPYPLTMDSDKSVTAVFVRRYNLTVNVSPADGGSVSFSPSGGIYDEWVYVMLTAVPNPGYRFDRWEGAITSYGNPSPSVIMNSDKSVTVYFVRQFNLTTAVFPPGAGYVSPSPGPYDSGSNLNVSASGNWGYRFDHWEGDLGGNQNPAPLTLNTNKSVTAIFLQQFTLATAVFPSGAGTVDLAPPGGQYDTGTVVTLTATAAPGYHFDRWEWDLTGTTNPAQITMNANRSVTAVFVQRFTLTTAVFPPGAGTVGLAPPGTQYDTGTVVTLTASVAPGYRFNTWSGDLSGSANPGSLIMNGNKVVTAHFVQQYSFTLNKGGKGTGKVTVSPPGVDCDTICLSISEAYDTGAVISLTATADPGSAFAGWSGGGCAGTAPCTVTMDAAKTITVTFSHFLISPGEGTYGTTIILTGSNFGTKKGKVLLGGVALKVWEWTSGWIRCSLTKALSAGTYPIAIFPKDPKGMPPLIEDYSFVVMGPKIDKVEPSSGPSGTPVVVTGTFFGTKKGKVTIGQKSCKITSWTTDPITRVCQVTLVVPKDLPSGPNVLTVYNKVGSDAVEFSIP